MSKNGTELASWRHVRCWKYRCILRAGTNGQHRQGIQPNMMDFFNTFRGLNEDMFHKTKGIPCKNVDSWVCGCVCQFQTNPYISENVSWLRTNPATTQLLNSDSNTSHMIWWIYPSNIYLHTGMVPSSRPPLQCECIGWLQCANGFWMAGSIMARHSQIFQISIPHLLIGEKTYACLMTS